MSSSALRVAVLSSTAVGRRSVEEGVLQCGACALVGIVTTPASICISYSDTPVHVRTFADFAPVAARAGCDFVRLSERPSKAEYLPVLERWRPDVILALGWYYVVPREVRVLAPRGCLGIHASLLPKYRGGAPIPWSIINGERETGVTLFHLEDEVDAGDIVAQVRVPIAARETCADVIERVAVASIDVLRQALPLLAAGCATRTPQRHEDATWFPQRKPEDGRIDWRLPASRVHDFVRAQTRPYSGAFTLHRSEAVRVWSAVPSRHQARPGEFHICDGVMLVGCGEGSLAVRELGVGATASCTPGQFAALAGAARGWFAVP